MIFVTLGTQDKQFKRLLKIVYDLDLQDEKIIVQKGSTKIEKMPKHKENFEIYDFLSEEKFNKYLEESSCIICHAGVRNNNKRTKIRQKNDSCSKTCKIWGTCK